VAGSVIGWGERAQWSGIRDAPMGPVRVVVPLVFAQGVEQVRLVPDECAIEQFVTAGLDPPFHDGVHAGHLHTGEHDRDAGVGEDGVEQDRVFAVAIADEVLHLASGVLDVHGEVAAAWATHVAVG
jgi:hypothetical protein